MNSRVVARDWFGRDSVSINQELPTELSKISEGADYDLDYLLSHHTLYNIYAHFTNQSEKLKRLMLGSNAQSLANVSMISQLGASSHDISNVCPLCYAEDIERIGVGYWRLNHQFYGVKACAKHGCELVAQRVDSRHYTLPSLPSNHRVEKASTMQVMFAVFVEDFIAQSKEFDATKTDGLKSYPLAFKRGRQLDMKSLLHFLDAIERGLGLPRTINEGHLRRLILIPSQPIHPFKATLLRFGLSFLSKGLRNYPKREYRGVSERQALRCVSMLHQFKFSMREISRRVGVSMSYVKQTAKRLKLPVDERRKFITADMERNIIDMAINGQCRESIASKFEISVGAVEQIIQSVPNLTSWRQYLRMLEKRNQARSVLVALIQRHPNYSRTQLRKLAQKEYKFLYTYDKTWLFKNLPKPQKRVYHGYKQWIERDKSLLVKLKDLVRNWLLQQRTVPSLSDLDRAFKHEGWFTKSLHKMPLCWRYYRRVSKRFSNLQEKNHVRERCKKHN
ncbi:hypothetical protein EYQ95_11350 [Lysobacter sp. N42]|nr:hypothetical protein DQX04_11425 [Aliidiomarina sp. B3213]TCZ89475.1 hypothetical protein EYQ95_11350 [Lysobacter sp. N42]